MKSFISKLRLIPKLILAVILSPLRLFLSVRRSMTGASVTLLLIGIITLNIVWGYPWTGMFAASISLLVVGWIVSRMMRPRLRIGFSLPSSSPAESTFSVITHLENRRSLPAMDLSIHFDSLRATRRRKRGGSLLTLLSQPPSIGVIHPAEHVDLPTSIRFDRRGIHELPDVVVTSMFPFHLFRSTRRFPSKTSIAITPRPLSNQGDEFSRGMLSALGGWSHKLLAGDALDYTGSREYQTGMSVRRWDFASWARLGRPIIREFQSPSVQTASLIVDTAPDDSTGGSDEDMERLLSLAATALLELTRKLVRVRLYVTGEDAEIITGDQQVSGTSTDCESFLIRLAAAKAVSRESADQQVAIVLEHVSAFPVLVLTTRPRAAAWEQLPATVTVLRFDSPSSDPLASAKAGSSRRRKAKPDRKFQAVGGR